MRERIARAVAALFVTALLALSVVFARAQNPEGPSLAAGPGAARPSAAGEDPAALRPAEGTTAAPAAPPRAESAPDTARGRVVYEEHGCTRCHSIAGLGSARNPLDGVGARRTLEELLAWTIGAESLADSLAPSAYRAKQAHRAIPPADLEALVAFLAGLRETGG